MWITLCTPFSKAFSCIPRRHSLEVSCLCSGALKYSNVCSFQSLDLCAARQVDSLAQSACPVVDGCTTVLGEILNEIAEIRVEATEKFFPSLLLYESHGEYPFTIPGSHCAIVAFCSESDSVDQCRPIRDMCEFLPLLQDLSRFLARTSLVFRNLLFQIRGFHGLKLVWNFLSIRNHFNFSLLIFESLTV